ncbi:hypothetical protein [Cellulophaga sp. BC115SP]|uniref:hypothetical protein n=1 Tax=Cellulophaga sp. BC115SP TaxID=2683263 RepID=UPI00141216BE|nr:hypothetical protein [Cellulophaga sp. BC115SP]NBB31048.1 hypothetical protein [Cellulophaga sp. BC115SP]
MKKTIASVTCGGLLLLVIPLLFLSCQNINPFNDIRFPNNMSNSHPPILIEFVDEDQPNIMFPKNLTISISGPDRNLVLSDLESKNHKIVGNLLSLVLSPNAKPSVQHPISFTITAKGKHYEQVSKNITISTLSNQSYTILMNYE